MKRKSSPENQIRWLFFDGIFLAHFQDIKVLLFETSWFPCHNIWHSFSTWLARLSPQLLDARIDILNICSWTMRKKVFSFSPLLFLPIISAENVPNLSLIFQPPSFEILCKRTYIHIFCMRLGFGRSLENLLLPLLRAPSESIQKRRRRKKERKRRKSGRQFNLTRHDSEPACPEYHAC